MIGMSRRGGLAWLSCDGGLDDGLDDVWALKGRRSLGEGHTPIVRGGAVVGCFLRGAR